jgi:hypothetical protein
VLNPAFCGAVIAVQEISGATCQKKREKENKWYMATKVGEKC